MKLGIKLGAIRNDNGYAEHKDELLAAMFDYESQYYMYDFMKLALLKYKEIYVYMLGNRNPIISKVITDISEEIWDMKLGNDVYHVRYGNYFTGHKDELVALGFDYKYENCTFDEIMIDSFLKI